jgi:hypothetical protein
MTNEEKTGTRPKLWDAKELRDMANHVQGAVILAWAVRLEAVTAGTPHTDLVELAAEMRATAEALLPPPSALPPFGEPAPNGARVRCIEPGSVYAGQLGTVEGARMLADGLRYAVRWDGWSGTSAICEKPAVCLELQS